MVTDNSFSERTVLCLYPKLTIWVQNISQMGPQKTKCLQLVQSYFFAVPEKNDKNFNFRNYLSSSSISPNYYHFHSCFLTT